MWVRIVVGFEVLQRQMGVPIVAKNWSASVADEGSDRRWIWIRTVDSHRCKHPAPNTNAPLLHPHSASSALGPSLIFIEQGDEVLFLYTSL